MQERIQKIISAAGITSRRAAEQLILDGRVRVNGRVVSELGTKADALKDHIKVDGKLINPRQPLSYIIMNKPAGYVTTLSDPEGRPTVQDLLKGVHIRVYPVGRLDYNTEGLLLLTNDGDFAHLITHPRHEFPKTYRAKVKGVLEDKQIEQLEQGIYLDDGKTAPASLKKVSKEEANSWIDITIHEGRKRQVRRMFDRVGHSVIRLKRIKVGNLVLGDLPEGSFRYLTPDEVKALRELAKADQYTAPVNRKPGVRQVRKDGGTGKRWPGTKATVSAKRHTRSRTAGPEHDEMREPRAMRSAENKHQRTSGGTRVPGRGASGRGPRRSAGEAGRQGGRREGKKFEFQHNDGPRTRAPREGAGKTGRPVAPKHHGSRR